uniref:Uncharacterized protein n=1 Tax=Picea glauca TaxID=3330 RepID=A0A101LVP3_PICGL|nr:hypothetical protein ABT39_MTgene2015 [Picea glauca]
MSRTRKALLWALAAYRECFLGFLTLNHHPFSTWLKSSSLSLEKQLTIAKCEFRYEDPKRDTGRAGRGSETCTTTLGFHGRIHTFGA